MNHRTILGIYGILSLVFIYGGGYAMAQQPTAKLRLYNAETKQYEEVDPVVKSKEEWKNILPAESYRVAREHGTERPDKNEYKANHPKGIYQCIACGTHLFSSEHKFNSGTGWPSFWKPIAPENVGEKADNSLFMRRTEVHCPRCQSHLGHVFDDGPPPTNLRYCINAVSLKFKAQGQASEK